MLLFANWPVLQGLTPSGYWHHIPLYHIDHPNMQGPCQVGGMLGMELRCGRHATLLQCCC